MDKIDRSLTLSWPMLDHNLFFIRFRTEKERSPSMFATGSVRYSCEPASRGALGRGLLRLCLNPPLAIIINWHRIPQAATVFVSYGGPYVVIIMAWVRVPYRAIVMICDRGPYPAMKMVWFRGPYLAIKLFLIDAHTKPFLWSDIEGHI
jgi:hypothetical protein